MTAKNQGAKNRRFLKVTKFINKLYQLLETRSSSDSFKTIHWGESGKEFVIPERKSFQKTLKETFNLTNYASFIRQLNIYGFRKIKSKKGDIFKHFYFRQGKEISLIKIQRKTRNMQRIERNHCDIQVIKQNRLISKILFMDRQFKKRKRMGWSKESDLLEIRQKLQKKVIGLRSKCCWLKGMAGELIAG